MTHKPFKVEVSVSLNITDPGKLIAAARERYVERNAHRDDTTVVSEALDFIDDVRSALRELIEPDGPISGAEILDSWVKTSGAEESS